jgi:predicted nucleic acid-binding protein
MWTPGAVTSATPSTFNNRCRTVTKCVTIGVQHHVSFIWRPTARDTDDDFLVDLAIAAHADFLVTFNVRDLQPVESYGIKVVTPKRMLEILRGVP